jgi:hypothetical protein
MNTPLLLFSRVARINADTLSRFIRPLVIFSVLVLSIGAGLAAGLDRLSVALLFGLPTIAFVGWILFTRKFEMMVLALPINALIAPFDLPTGTYSKIPVSLLMSLALCAIWFVTMGIRNQWRFAPTLLNRPALAFCFACFISYLWSSLWRDPLINMGAFGNFTIVQIASLLTFYASIGAALLIGNFVRTEKQLQFIFWSFICLGTLMTLTQTLHINQYFLSDRGLWGLWTALPAFCYLIAQKNARWYVRIMLVAVIALNLYQTVIVNLQWKSGWIPTIVGMFIAVFLRSKKLFVILIAVSLVFAYIGRDVLIEMTQAEEAEGADERIGMWEINLRIIGDHWLLGTGPAGYAVYYMTYYPDDARSTHNNYLDIIAQFGIIGSVTWLWLTGAGIIEGFRQLKASPPGFTKTLALTATSGWIAAQFSMFFGDWVLPFAYNQTITGFKYTVYSWVFLGTLVAIRSLNDRQSARADQGSSA